MKDLLGYRRYFRCPSVYDNLQCFDVYFTRARRFSKKTTRSSESQTFSREHQEHTPNEGNSIPDDSSASGSFRSPLHYKFLSRVGVVSQLVLRRIIIIWGGGDTMTNRSDL
jgi:hypothetical protein